MSESARAVRPACSALAAALVAIATIVSTVADDESTAADRVERGGVLFRIHCASCHGEGGRGDGPVSGALKDRPTDLTRIAERRGGDFPAAEVVRTIDGRQPIRAHGATTMPVWGLSLRDPGRDSDQESEVRDRVESLVAYLESIQHLGETPAPN